MTRFRYWPVALAAQLSHDINDVIGALHTGRMHTMAAAYLRDTIALATNHLLFAGITVIAVVTLIIVVVLPRQLPMVQDKSAQR